MTFVGVLFIHDAFTYTSKHAERVPVSPLALHPELGGPKNLPIAKVLIDDDDVSSCTIMLVFMLNSGVSMEIFTI